MKPIFAFCIFAVLTIFTIPFGSDFSASIIPGWHATILLPRYPMCFVILIFLVLSAICYGILVKRKRNINPVVFCVHVLLTVPELILAKYPFLVIPLFSERMQRLDEMIMHMYWLYLISALLFVTGQVVFFVYFFRIKKNMRLQPKTD